MLHVLVICAGEHSLERPLALIANRVKLITCMTRDEIQNISTLDDLSVYSMIVLGPIDWRIPTTTDALARQFIRNFQGPIVAISSDFEWRKLLKMAGCTHLLKNEDASAPLLRDILFPPTKDPV